MSANILEKTPYRLAALPKTISSQNPCANNRGEMTVAEKCLWVDKVRSKFLEEASHPEHGLRIMVGHANLLKTLDSVPRDHDTGEVLIEQRFKPNIDAPTKDTRCNQHYYHDGTASDNCRNLAIYSWNNKHDNYSNDEIEVSSSESDSISDTEITWSSFESLDSDSSSDSEYDWPEIYTSVEAALYRLNNFGSENSE